MFQIIRIQDALVVQPKTEILALLEGVPEIAFQYLIEMLKTNGADRGCPAYRVLTDPSLKGFYSVIHGQRIHFDRVTQAALEPRRGRRCAHHPSCAADNPPQAWFGEDRVAHFLERLSR
ncbi:hypothetical protein GCM10011579_081750 [Streptomyces albiflavescens]|uniref:Uncharacterized protein n=1 Tax=Streptomyces albiflavescens TaxID=1623582 RepID=A0A918D9U8_9ACTN|nr:hypothetical protein GCM10011579_081750 [Streptomyces albiflavescens]